MQKGSSPILRIGAGMWCGRKLLPPPDFNTRPITGFAKKSLFGILAPRLGDAVVLDLYCGTGTLGLEALSHGARRCCFAELSKPVLERLRGNIELCGAQEMSVVWAGDLEKRLPVWLAECFTKGEKVDIAFVDPPFPAARRWQWDAMVEKIFTPLAEALAEDGLVALRLPGDTPPPETLGQLHCERIKVYGDMTITLYGRVAGSL